MLPHQTCPAGVASVRGRAFRVAEPQENLRMKKCPADAIAFTVYVGEVETEEWSGVIVQRFRMISNASDKTWTLTSFAPARERRELLF
jgi:hypothetical protein